MAASLVANGLDPKSLPEKTKIDLGKELDHEVKAWKEVWSAGQGVGSIDDSPPTAELVARLKREFDDANRSHATKWLAA